MWNNQIVNGDLPNYKAKPTIPQLEKAYRIAARARTKGTRKCPVWIDKNHNTFGHYYLHYDPKAPADVIEDNSGVEEFNETVPYARRPAPVNGSVVEAILPRCWMRAAHRTTRIPSIFMPP